MRQIDFNQYLPPPAAGVVGRQHSVDGAAAGQLYQGRAAALVPEQGPLLPYSPAMQVNS